MQFVPHRNRGPLYLGGKREKRVRGISSEYRIGVEFSSMSRKEVRRGKRFID